jgi:hypothetical protein
MTARKRRQKNQRRARRLAEQAWEADDEGNPNRSLRIIRRAIDANPSNPVLWNDLGLLLLRHQRDDDEAARAFLSAITLAPEMADPYAQLAEIRARQGLLHEAISLQNRAVALAPDVDRFARRLDTWRRLIGHDDGNSTESESVSQDSDQACSIERSLRSEFPFLADCVDALQWSTIDGELARRGCSHIRQLLTRETCSSLCQMSDDDELFARTVVMNTDQFGRGSYRYFASPLPRLIEAIRRLTYPHVAKIANRWQRQLGKDSLFPVTWEVYRLRCEAAGQTTPTPILLKYEAGGFNALHQDIRGAEFFPIQLLIVLSPIAEDWNQEGFSGGEFLFCDEPERKKKDRKRIAAGIGDAVLFCTRARPVQIGGAWGLTPVKHGMARIESGNRFALGIPFHEYE